MSTEKMVIEISSQYVTWRDQKIEQLSYLMALEKIIENLTDACAPGQEIAKTLQELKEHGTQIILRGPEAHLQCALLHLHTLYGEDLGALALAQGQELSSSLFVLDPTEGLTSDVSSQLMAAAEESALKTFTLADEALEQLKQIQSIPDPTAGLQDELEQLRAEFEKSVIKVLVYGGTAAGKSTYLNALLGGAYLPTSTRDVCTGSLIYLKYTTDEPRFEVYWRDQKPVTRSSNLGELPTYTDETAPQTQADEVSEVHVYLPLPLLKHLQLIDAPGSRDGDERRQALLDQALSEVDAFLYLLPLERGTQDYKQDLTRLEERSELSEARAYVFTKADAVTGSSLEQLEHRRRDVGVTMPATLCAAKPLLDLTQGLTSGTSIEELIYQVMPALRSLHQLDYKQSRRLEDALHHLPQALILSYVRESCWVESGLHMVTAPLLMKRLESLQGRVKKHLIERCCEVNSMLEVKMRYNDSEISDLSLSLSKLSKDDLFLKYEETLQTEYIKSEQAKISLFVEEAKSYFSEQFSVASTIYSHPEKHLDASFNTLIFLFKKLKQIDGDIFFDEEAFVEKSIPFLKGFANIVNGLINEGRPIAVALLPLNCFIDYLGTRDEFRKCLDKLKDQIFLDIPVERKLAFDKNVKECDRINCELKRSKSERDCITIELDLIEMLLDMLDDIEC